MTVPVRERKTAKWFFFFLNESKTYGSIEIVMRNQNNLSQRMMVTLETIKAAKRTIRLIHKRQYSGIKTSEFTLQLI